MSVVFMENIKIMLSLWCRAHFGVPTRLDNGSLKTGRTPAPGGQRQVSLQILINALVRKHHFPAPGGQRQVSKEILINGLLRKHYFLAPYLYPLLCNHVFPYLLPSHSLLIHLFTYLLIHLLTYVFN